MSDAATTKGPAKKAQRKERKPTSTATKAKATHIRASSAPSSSSKPDSCLSHCTACGANSGDTPFSMHASLPLASTLQCTPCYEVWIQTANIMDWPMFANLYSDSPQFAENVEKAKHKPKAPPRDEHGYAVKSKDAFEVRLLRRGRLLTKADLKFDSQKFTPKQLKLKHPVESGNECGFKAKGFIIMPPSSDLEVEVSCSVAVSKEVAFLEPGATTMEDIVEEGVRRALQDGHLPSNRKPFLDLLQGKSPTLADLRSRAERCDRLRVNRRVAGGRGDDTSRKSDASDDEEGSSENGEHEVSDKDGGNDDTSNDGDDPAAERPGRSIAATPMAMMTTSRAPSMVASNSTPQKPKGEASFFVMPAATVVVECSNGLVWRAETATGTANPSPIKLSGNFDDGMSTISAGSSVSKAKRGSLPPDYWIQKCSLIDCMLAPVDRRIPLQASNCVERERKKGGDSAGADRLQRHLRDFAIAQGLQEDTVETQDDCDTETAIAAMRRLGVPLVPGTLLGIFKRRLKQTMDMVKSDNSEQNFMKLLRMLLPFFADESAPKFEVKAPVLNSMLSLQPASVISKRFEQGMSEVLCSLIASCEVTSDMAPLAKMIGLALDLLETLPDDADPPEPILRAIADCQKILRGLAMLLNPSIDESTDMTNLDDLLILDSPGQCDKSSLIHSVANAIANTEKTSLKLAMIVKRGVAWTTHGPQLQKHFVDMASIRDDMNSSALDANYKLLERAFVDFEKYSVSMPDGSMTKFQERLLAATVAFSTAQLSMPNLQQSAHHSTQTLLQTAARCLPMAREIDAMIEQFAEKLRATSNDGKTQAFMNIVSKIKGGETGIETCAEFRSAVRACHGVELDEQAQQHAQVALDMLWGVAATSMDSDAARDEMLDLLIEGASKLDKNAKKSMELKVAMLRAAAALKESAKKLRTAIDDSATTNDDIDDTLKKTSRTLAGFRDAQAAMRKHNIADENLDFAETENEVATLLTTSARAAIDARLRGIAQPLSALQALARGNPADAEHDWVEELTNAADWQAILNDTTNTLMRLNKQELDHFLPIVIAFHERLTTMRASYKIKYDSIEIETTIRRARLVQAAYELMFVYTHNGDDTAEMRTQTRAITEHMTRHGLRANDLPAGLQLRIKAAMKLRTL